MHKVAISLILIISTITTATQLVSGERRMVGARMKIRDVKANREVQDLGRFSVEQFNRNHQAERINHHILLHHQGGDEAPLQFEEVVEAERQVVAGIKYYLKIKAADHGGPAKTFDAVVVVVPWLQSKELLTFAPSSQ